jgi:hypothetical protein
MDIKTCNVIELHPEIQHAAALQAIALNFLNAPAGFPELEVDRIAVLTNKYWGTSGVRLTVGFLDNPTAALKSRILGHMNAWNRTANVQFVETATDPQVRISRDPNSPNGYYWSNLGTDILLVGQNQPTMNLANFTEGTPESEFIRVVRHETGHTLGFPHEHKRKAIVDRIDREKAIAYFMATQHWTAEVVVAQVLTPIEESALIHTEKTDPDSIMCYWLPGSIMKDDVAVPGGPDIDAQDARFAGIVYPKISDIGLPPPDAGWKVVGVGDFDGDGKADLAWRRQDESGEVRIWFLDGAGGLKKDVGLPAPDAGWKVVGIGDFDGDGKADLAWRRRNGTGEVRIWFLDGAGGLTKDVGLPEPAPGWKVVGVGDFDGDGKADLAWRRVNDTGEARIWLLDGAGGLRQDIGLRQPDPGWRVVGVADFDGDKKADLAWRRSNNTGEVRLWLLDGAGGLRLDIGLPQPDPNWSAVGFGDFNGNGKADVVWRRSDNSGEARLWILDGTGVLQTDMGLPQPSPGWSVVGVGDFDGNGKADLAWRRSDNTGEVRLWTFGSIPF